MKYKRIVAFCAFTIFVVAGYCLSFSWVDYKIQRQAEQQARDSSGKIDFDRHQAYLMQIWKKPVYNILGIAYSYEEIKERSLKLGLDLQGGMQVTLELSPVELVKGLAGYSTDPIFLEALETAKKKYEKGISTPFSKLFLDAYTMRASVDNLKHIFSTEANQSKSYIFTNESDIIKIIDQEIKQALNRSMIIIRSRLDRFGAFQPNIQLLPGSGKIQIELPGVTHPQRVKKLLQGIARLRFWEVAEPNECNKLLEAVDAFLLNEEKKRLEKTFPKEIVPEEKERLTPKLSILKKLALSTYPFYTYSLQHMEEINRIFRRKEIQSLLPKQIKWMWSKEEKFLQNGIQGIVLYPIKQAENAKPLLEGDIIMHASHGYDENRRGYIIDVRMHPQATRTWHSITAKNIGKQIAITLDDQVYSAPVVQQEIPNGRSQISGSFTLEEAKDLASILQTGSLPAPLKIVEEVIMGPSLGKIAQKQGLVATAVGLALILLFMSLYYAQAGIIASVGLLFNLFFIAGILVQLDTTLTLPGIAGLVLTIGMSIDANVLIFERIREELAQKVHIKEAIYRGYEKSYSSIIDSNITTFLAGTILYYLGQGPIRSFALVLMIGILTSAFSSIFLTQLFFSFFIDRNFVHSITFSNHRMASPFKNISFNFIKNRYRFYLFSLLFIATGILCFYQKKGLTLGVDFVGGRSYIVDFNKPLESSLLKEKLSSILEGSIEVRSYGANNVMKITAGYVNNESIAPSDKEMQNKLEAALQSFIEEKEGKPYSLEKGNHGFSIVSSNNVGATVAHDVQKSAKKAIVLAFCTIFIYVALRFRQWKYGVAALSALIHDVVVVIAGFSIAQALGYNYEINEVFIAAILTIIGYSINDTVVIFDRIREKLSHKHIKATTAIINLSIRETLSRTMITSFTTLLAIMMLFLCGGEALRGFSFALLLGVLFGTYSSICIAAPLLADLKEKAFTNR